MLTLNDDCLEYIFQSLTLDDQIALKNSCRRFERVVLTLWRRRCKRIHLTTEQMKYFEKNKRDLSQFFNSVCDNLEHFEFQTIYSRQMRLLEDFTFPKNKTFAGVIQYSEDGTNDQDALAITHMFPNLERLALESSISGKYLWQLNRLVDLDLSCCENLDTKYFTKIFSTLKLRKVTLMYYGYSILLGDHVDALTLCRSLEEIAMDDHHLFVILEYLLKMPKVHRITCYTRDYDEVVLQRISDVFGPRIDSIMYRDVFWSKDEHVHFLIKMCNLRKLSIQEDDIEEEQLEEIASHLKNIEELYFEDLRFGGWERGIFSFIRKCKKLTLIDVTHSALEDEVKFVECVIKLVEQQITRMRPLEIRGIPAAVRNSYSQKLPSMLYLSDKKSNEEPLPLSRCFRINWERNPTN